MNTLPATTFIKACEIWLPSADATLLEFGSGLYGDAARLSAISPTLCFGRGEGLPGQAWEEGHPVLLTTLEGSVYRRTAAAQAAGLTCALALPVFVGDSLSAVVVFYCGAAEAGALELWCNKVRVTPDMTLVDGCYGSTDAALEALSREAFLPRGAGLPGLAWQRDAVVFIDDIGQSAKFLRAETAASAGITQGLAMPCATTTHDNYVVAFLSAAASPVARRVECWSMDATQSLLQRSFGYCEVVGPLPAAGTGAAGTLIAPGPEGVIGRAFSSGVPVLTDDVGAEPGSIGSSASAVGLASMLALPVVSEGRVAEVLVLYF